MAKGRKRIPTKLHILRNNPGKRPINDQEPQPPEKMPRCPKHLDAAAKKEWRRAGKILQSIGLMTDLDMAEFASYCEAYSRWVRLCNERQEIEKVVGEQDIDLTIDNQRVLQYRDAYRRWVKAMKEVQQTGLIYKKANLQPGQNPYLQVEQNANAQMTAIRKEIAKACGDAKAEMKASGVLLGMSPSSRASLKVEKPKPMGKAEKFMARKNASSS